MYFEIYGQMYEQTRLIEILSYPSESRYNICFKRLWFYYFKNKAFSSRKERQEKVIVSETFLCNKNILYYIVNLLLLINFYAVNYNYV